MRVARPVVLEPEQKKALEGRTRARSASSRSVERARIVLLAGTGLQDQQIAAQLKITAEKAADGAIGFLMAACGHWKKTRPGQDEPGPSRRAGCAMLSG